MTDIGKCDECGFRMRIDLDKLKAGELQCPWCGHVYEVKTINKEKERSDECKEPS